jgi:hypothetical protein
VTAMQWLHDNARPARTIGAVAQPEREARNARIKGTRPMLRDAILRIALSLRFEKIPPHPEERATPASRWADSNPYTYNRGSVLSL